MDLVPKMDFLDVFYPHICYLTYSIPPHIRHRLHRTVLRISRLRVRAAPGAPDVLGNTSSTATYGDRNPNFCRVFDLRCIKVQFISVLLLDFCLHLRNFNQDRCYQFIHDDCGFPLHIMEHMSVDIQSNAWFRMTQHTRYHNDWYFIVQ